MRNILGILFGVAFFVSWQMNVNYLEYDCIRDNEDKSVKTNVRIYKNNVVYHNLWNGKENYYAYKCQDSETTDYYDIRLCGGDYFTIDKRDNTYQSRNEKFTRDETWAISKGYCKKKNFITRIFYSYESFKEDKGFTEQNSFDILENIYKN